MIKKAVVKKALDGLKAELAALRVQYHLDGDGVCNRWHHSKVRFEGHAPAYVAVYADSDIQELILLAHEVGHLKTTVASDYNSNKPHYERVASEWAYSYLLNSIGRVFADNARREVYSRCLDTYISTVYSGWPFPIEAILKSVV